MRCRMLEHRIGCICPAATTVAVHNLDVRVMWKSEKRGQFAAAAALAS